MADFSPDPVFLRRAFEAIRHLEHIVDSEPRANHRLDRLVSDIESVCKRYLRGDHCKTCEGHAPLPAIQHIVFCRDRSQTP